MTSQSRFTFNGFRYMLRRNLPLWKPGETIEETIAFCRRVKIDEIIWKVDAEEFNHGFTPVGLVCQYVEHLREAKRRQDSAGIVFSINPWLTQNHIGRMRYPAGPPEGFWWRVSPEGETSPEMACPLSPGWRAWLLESYRLYATTNPDKLWIEDDFKTFLHQAWKLGCFCDAHLRLFEKTVGQRLTREELVQRLIAPGSPDTIRGRWLDFQGQILVDLCRQLEQVVHVESPTTRLGQMCSWSTDGRWWSEAMTALAGPLKPLARTSLAPYTESLTTDFLPDQSDILKEMASLPSGTENCPELENSLYSAYSKSTRTTGLQLFMAELLGNHGITMNLFDMVGSPMEEDSGLGAMLSAKKPLLDTMVHLDGPQGAFRGVAIPYNKRFADFKVAEPDQGFGVFRFDGEGWCHVLQGSGIPIVWNGPGPVFALTGQSERSMTRSEIEILLRGGVLLDGSAASVLCDLGFGRQIGVTANERVDRRKVLISAECDAWNAELKPQNSVYLSFRHPAPNDGRLYPLTALPGAVLASAMIDPDHRFVMLGFVCFENDWGGRVAVHPLDLSQGISVGFMNWQRRRQIQRLVRWLGRDQVDLIIGGGAWMLPMRKDFSDYILLAVLNFDRDDWERLTLTFHCEANIGNLRFQTLDQTGGLSLIQPKTLNHDGCNVNAEFALPVSAYDLGFLKVNLNR